MEVGSMIMFGIGYSEPRQRPTQISIDSVHIFLVLVSVSVSVSGTGRARLIRTRLIRSST